MRDAKGRPLGGLLVGWLGLLLASPVEAQLYRPTPVDVVPGDSVRVQATGNRPVEGTVIRWRRGSLVVAVPGLPQGWALPIEHIDALHRYQAVSPRDAFRKGMVLGVAAGVFVGAAVGLALYSTGVTHDEDGPPGEQLIGSVLKYSGLFSLGGGLTWGFIKARNPGVGWVGVTIPIG